MLYNSTVISAYLLVYYCMLFARSVLLVMAVSSVADCACTGGHTVHSFPATRCPIRAYPLARQRASAPCAPYGEKGSNDRPVGSHDRCTVRLSATESPYTPLSLPMHAARLPYGFMLLTVAVHLFQFFKVN